jgi:hypothetical protein
MPHDYRRFNAPRVPTSHAIALTVLLALLLFFAGILCVSLCIQQKPVNPLALVFKCFRNGKETNTKDEEKPGPDPGPLDQTRGSITKTEIEGRTFITVDDRAHSNGTGAIWPPMAPFNDSPLASPPTIYHFPRDTFSTSPKSPIAAFRPAPSVSQTSFSPPPSPSTHTITIGAFVEDAAYFSPPRLASTPYHPSPIVHEDHYDLYCEQYMGDERQLELERRNSLESVDLGTVPYGAKEETSQWG